MLFDLMANNEYQKQMRRRSKRIQDKKMQANTPSVPRDLIQGLTEFETKFVLDTLCGDPYHHYTESRDQTIELEICQRLRETGQCIQDAEDMEDRDPQYRYQIIRKIKNKKKDVKKKQRLSKNSYAQLCGVFEKCFKQFRVPSQKYESLRNETKEDLLQTLNKSTLKGTIIKVYTSRQLKKYIQLSQADRSQKVYNWQVCRKLIASAIIGKKYQQKTLEPLYKVDIY